MNKNYKATTTDYIEKGHAERIPEEALDVNDRPVLYLPHHPVTHPRTPDKVTVRSLWLCCQVWRDILESALVAGTDQTNQLAGVLSRFRQDTVSVVADIEGMFH